MTTHHNILFHSISWLATGAIILTCMTVQCFLLMAAFNSALALPPPAVAATTTGMETHPAESALTKVPSFAGEPGHLLRRDHAERTQRHHAGTFNAAHLR